MLAALELPSEGSRAKAADYREGILILLHKKFSHERIAQFLRAEGVKISQTAISSYLRKHSPTDAELTCIRRMLAERANAEPNGGKSNCEPSESRKLVRKRLTEPDDNTD